MIELLVGMIASGKSTYTSKRAREGAIVLNDDSLVSSLHGGNYDLYNKDLKPLYKIIPLVATCMVAADNRDVIIDSTNLTRKVRSRWIGIARMLDLPISCICFEKCAPEIHAKRRCFHDARGYDFHYWLKVAEHHNSIYEEPTIDEGFSGITIIRQQDKLKELLGDSHG